MKTTLRIAIASALAVTGSAYAVDFDTTVNPQTGAFTVASELVSDGTNVDLTLNGDRLLTTAGAGINSNQNRFVRYDLTNATFGTAITNTALQDLTSAQTNAAAAAAAIVDAPGSVARIAEALIASAAAAAAAPGLTAALAIADLGDFADDVTLIEEGAIVIAIPAAVSAVVTAGGVPADVLTDAAVAAAIAAIAAPGPTDVVAINAVILATVTPILAASELVIDAAAAAAAVAAAAAALVTNSGYEDNDTLDSGVTIFSGGQVGDSCVVFEVEGLNATILDLVGPPPTVASVGGNQQNDVIALTLPDINVTDGTQGVSADYSIHELGAAAHCVTGSAANPIASSTATIIDQMPGVVFTTTDGVPVTMDAAVGYVEEDVDALGLVIGGVRDALQLGVLTSDLDDAAFDLDRSTLLVADFFGTTDLTIAGDFSAAGTVTMVAGNFPGPGGTCDGGFGPVVATAAVAADGLSATFVSADIQADLFDNNNAAANTHTICYNVDGTTEVIEENYVANLAVASAPTAVVPNFGPSPAGVIEHNGTVLKAPFAKGGQGGTGAFINLVNTSPAPAPYTVECFSKAGNPAVAGTPGTVPANESLKLYMSAIGCPTASADGYNSIEILLPVEPGTVTGTFMRENLSTGVTGFSDMTGNE